MPGLGERELRLSCELEAAHFQKSQRDVGRARPTRVASTKPICKTLEQNRTSAVRAAIRK